MNESNSIPAAGGPSHAYEGPWTETIWLIGLILTTVLVVSGAAWTLRRAGIGSRSMFRGDPDSTIIATKVGMARAASDKDLILVGDSSCLMNLDVATLESAGARSVINLGALSYLGLDSFGRLAGEAAKNGKGVRRVLLAVHPDCLRLASPSGAHEALLQSALSGRGVSALQPDNPVADKLGLHAFRTHVVDQWVPEPLRGSMGAKYGFTECMEREMQRRLGCLDEPARLSRTNLGSAEYRLATRLENECKAFRKGLPAGTRIRVLITPVPKVHALRSHEAKIAEMRTQIEKWLDAETPGPVMPAILPDEDFGTVTHLLPAAAVRYSRQLGEQLAAWK